MTGIAEKKYQIPDFQSDDERDAWIAENADYFTVVRLKTPLTVREAINNVRSPYERHEKPSMKEAIELASTLMKEHNHSYIIYAVYGPYQAFVTTVTPPNRME